MTRVLIVDDHDGFRAFARRLLEAAGFSVVGEAADGRSAVRAALDLRPDVVLLDVQLPDLDGFEVIRRLQGGPAAPGDPSAGAPKSPGAGPPGVPTSPAPAIVLTSSRERGDYGDRVEGSGCRGFISKAELSGRALCEIVQGRAPA